MTVKSHSTVRKPHKHEDIAPAPEPIEPMPVPPPPAIPTKPSRANRLAAAINEIEALVGDKYPISNVVQAVIKRAKSSD
jgi:hypothetical protein